MFLKRNHAEDMPCMFQLTADDDQHGRGQATYPMYLGDAENDLNQSAIASLAADRCAWRKFVVACSAAE